MEALKQVPKSQWSSCKAELLSENNLVSLFDGVIPAIILPGFISPKDCTVIIENLRQTEMGTYSHVSHAVGRLGLAQMEYHLKGDMKGYFDRVAETKNIYLKVVGGAEDPVQKLMSYLAHATSKQVSIASEQSFGSYFAGTFRNVMTVGHLHYDFAPFEAKGWDISKIEKQLSWNLYLNQPSGGDLNVYNRFYQPADEKLRVPDQYYYDSKIVSGAQKFTYTPSVGDVVIFNSRNIHEVKPVDGERYSLSSFVGKKPSGDLILWS